jgi:hypothetical protein
MGQDNLGLGGPRNMKVTTSWEKMKRFASELKDIGYIYIYRLRNLENRLGFDHYMYADLGNFL